MRCTVVHGTELTDETAGRWSGLQQANPMLASPYFCADFTRAVAAVRDDVRVVIVEDGREVVACFPFQRNAFGQGRPVAGPLSDYQGVISASNEGWSAAEIVRGAGLSSWQFDHLLCAQTPFAAYHTSVAESPLMDLSRGYASYVEERRAAGSKQIRSLGTLRRKFEREVAPLRFEMRTTDAATLTTLLRWKSEQCRASGGVDVFGARWTNELVERLMHTESEDFAGVLSALYAGEELVAAHFGMRSRTVWHYWFPSYNEQFSKYSPGLLLLLEMAEASETLGIRSIDLGKGSSFYKDRLKSCSVPIAEGCIELPSVASSLRRWRRGAEAWAKTSALAAPARYPGRALKRFEKWMRFR
jgi:CelD/BcsL family acetyltransferase involved in cellulose biosynthesis